MSSPKKTAPNDDFDLDQYRGKLNEAHDIVTRPDKFAEIFCHSLSSQRKMGDIFREEFVKMLRTDIDAKDALKAIIKDSEKEDLRSFFKKVGFAGWSFFVSIVSIILTVLAGKYL